MQEKDHPTLTVDLPSEGELSKHWFIPNELYLSITYCIPQANSIQPEDLTNLAESGLLGFFSGNICITWLVGSRQLLP